ncbi:hypothetical protein [Halohasta litorea]|uniref:Uncharacterized protein n=1 Tax=Halohasta litorea TaxID=869891 RepID=A0ABD6D876_9EURY|nr:hypothetical protein [Halohasta litorea]
MATDTHQQVDELLADLAAVFEDEPTADGHPDSEALVELADRADELVAVTELSELSDASGLGDEAEPPASLPAAVASGAPEHVARLRSLLTAAKVSRADGDRRAALVDELRSLVAVAQGESAEGEPTSEATGDDTESTSGAASDGPAPTETEAEEAEEPTSPIRDLLRSQLEDTHGIFDGIPDIETLTGGLDENEDDEEQTKTADADESHEEQSTRKSDGTRWRPGGGTQRTTHSTVPTTGRRDIGRRPGRFSSVRGSTVSKR